MWTKILCFQWPFTKQSTKTLEAITEGRNKIYQDELACMLGNDIVLSNKEQKANNVIMQLKEKVLDKSFDNPKDFYFAKHFFEYKDTVKETKLYRIIQKMPKGAVLHVHDTGLVSPDYLVSLTYSENLYIAFENSDYVKFLFSKEQPQGDKLKWQLLSEARYSSGDIQAFDARLRKYFSVVVENPNKVYPDINTAWNTFQNYFINTGGLLTYKPVWEKYFYETLKTFKEDNIMYIEIRSVLPELYDLDGKIYNSIDTAQSYKDVLDVFKKDHPDFFGAKLIYAPLRRVDVDTVKEYIDVAKKIKKQMPDFFAGFDLVGQEDLGKPIKDFLPILIEAADDLDYFFHAGETNWYGSTTDENLIDAVALGAKRIGHGYALLKHPLVMERVKQNHIALEVNVVSNLVLKLVDDVRNHPLAAFLAHGLPVVLSSDDPGTWEADPLSHDFYITFVGVSSRHADLRLLKKLALNSLNYSCASFKDKMVVEFENRWDQFIENVIEEANIAKVPCSSM